LAKRVLTGLCLPLVALTLFETARADTASADIPYDDTNVYPESISAARDGTIYSGSIKGIIFRAKPGSGKAVPWIKPSAENGLLGVFGVLVDERRKTLWVCSAGNNLRNPPAVGDSSLMSFDLASGKRTGNYTFPKSASAPAPVCNDITVARDGTVFASDTPGGRILKLAKGATTLEVFADDPRLKGIDGIVLSEDGVLYLNIVTKGQLLRVDRKPDGSLGGLTELAVSDKLGGPDGFRLIHGKTFLLAEGTSGKIDQVTIDGDRATVKVLREGLISPPAVTLVGHTAYAAEGKITYLIDPKLKGQDPGPFRILAIPLGR
jgi:sugar lactone lactonase YvrE